MKIYFCGSMTFDHSKAFDYQKMIEKLEDYGEVLNKFVGNNEVKEFEPAYVFKRDTSNLDNADLLVADVTVVSTGVGFEIGYFTTKNKPMLILYDETRPVPSASVRGILNSQVDTYKNINEALLKIDEFMKNAK